MGRPNCFRWRSIAAPAFLACLAFLAACAEDGDLLDPDDKGNIAVSISPTSATLDAGATQSFTATVSGTTNAAVTWQASGGTVSGSGATVTYTAPVQAGSYTVTATSSADPSRSATASVTVNQIQIALNSAAVTLKPGSTFEFTATVTGAADTGVNWAVTCGDLDVDGAYATYTAPLEAGECTLSVASAIAPSVTATAAITIDMPETLDLVVTAIDDTDDGVCDAAHCSLREALALAVGASAARVSAGEAAANEGLGPSTIHFAESLLGQTITLTSELPSIDADVEIIGPGADQLTIDANAGPGERRRVFTIGTGAEVAISGLTVTGGSVDDGIGGGGIRVGSLNTSATLTDLRIVGNEVIDGEGGGLLVTANAHAIVDDVWISGNTAPVGGGVASVNSTLEMFNTTISENQALGGEPLDGVGGGLSVHWGHAALSKVTLSLNEAARWGGGASFEHANGTLTDVVVQDNTAGYSGGGIYSSGSAVEGEQVQVTGNTAAEYGGGFHVWGYFDPPPHTAEEKHGLALTASTISLNSAPGAGGIFVFARGVAVLTNSHVTGNEATSPDRAGGGIWSVGGSDLTLTSVEVTGNTAAGNGGGVAVEGPGSPDDVTWLDASGSTLSGNQAGGAGGGLFVEFGEASLTNVTISSNEAGTYGGGAAFDFSTGTLLDVLMEANGAGTNGGGLSHRYSAVEGSNVTVWGNATGEFGGGIFVDGSLDAGPDGLELDDATIAQNIARGGGGIRVFGGGIATLANSTVAENQATDMGNGGGGAWLGGGSSITLDDVQFLANTSAGAGGGLRAEGGSEVVMSAGAFGANQAGTGGGGGLALESGSTGTLHGIDLTTNEATGGSGGGVAVSSSAVIELYQASVLANRGGIGGGIFATTGGSATILASTIALNEAVHGAGLGLTLGASASVENSTFSGNESDENGAAIYTSDTDTEVAILNATIVDNVAKNGFGGGVMAAGGTITLVNTLLARNTQWDGPANCAGGMGGSIVSEGHNLSDDANCGGVLTADGDLNQANAGVSPDLGENGGPTSTHALLAGSDAIDAADPARCPATDQRGFGRAASCDIGAFEFNGVALDAALGAAVIGNRETP